MKDEKFDKDVNQTLKSASECKSTAYQKVDVCAPVTVTPYAELHQPTVKCNGKTRVCSGPVPCLGKKNGSCSFTIRQQIDVEVAVDFGASVSIGDA